MTNPTITLILYGSDDTIEVARHECSACRCAGFLVASGDYTPEVEHEGGLVLVERPEEAVPLQAGVEGGRELDRTYCEECAEARAEEALARAAIATASWVGDGQDPDTGSIPCSLRATDGPLAGRDLAGCVVRDGNVDVRSDGCGAFFGLAVDEIAWPDYADALEASGTPAAEWRATLDGGHAGETTLDGALSLDEAWQEALDWARSCDWDAEAGHEVRALLTVSRSHPEDEERQRDVVVQCAETSEEVPPCIDGEDHDLGDPMTYSLGGTSYSHHETCRVCGAVRVSLSHGSQRNPGDVDSVTWEPAAS